MKRTLAALVASAGLLFSTPVAHGGDLAQVVTADERFAPPGEEAVISAGHVDLGLVLTEEGPELLARDDSQPQPVWRHLDDVVFTVPDAAKQTLPEKDEFSFVGAKPGQDVWVLPQVEAAGVPWLGWNTQHPSLEQVDRGVTMSITGHSGPGETALFLQNGGFEPPLTLWSTTGAGDGSFWVDLHTHTHANWTFTEPGTQQVELTVDAQLVDGAPIHVSQPITFAVGDAADVTAAQKAVYEPAAGPESRLQMYIWAGLGALVLVALICFLTFRRTGRE